MTPARWLCAVVCIALLSACSTGDDALDDTGSRPKDAGTKDGDRDAASGNSGSGGKGGGSGGKGGTSAGGSGSDRDAASEMMGDASGGTGETSGTGGTSGSNGISGNEADPTKCGGATCPAPSICDHMSIPPICACPPGYHFVDVGGNEPPCGADCEGADCDAGS